jgi:hypothetical protein
MIGLDTDVLARYCVDDAGDATQEILLKGVTHLSGFRSDSAFSTRAWRVPYNPLTTARTRRARDIGEAGPRASGTSSRRARSRRARAAPSRC